MSRSPEEIALQIAKESCCCKGQCRKDIKNLIVLAINAERREKGEALNEIEIYKEMHEDYKRLVREIDEAISGKDGMAKQASLCDLVHPIRKLASRLALMEKVVESARDYCDPQKHNQDRFGYWKKLGEAVNALDTTEGRDDV